MCTTPRPFKSILVGFSLLVAIPAVAFSDGAQLISFDLPVALDCGESYAASVTMKNIGSSTWTRATHKLGAKGGEDPFYDGSRVRLPSGVTVPPNGSYTFEFTLSAPADLPLGVHMTDWQMVHELVAWFGDTAQSMVTGGCDDASQLVAFDLPETLDCGESYPASVTMRNTGTSTWTRNTHKLGAVNGSDPYSSVTRIRLPHGVTVPPQGTYTFTFTLTAENGMSPGNYLTDWQMVHELVAWFGDTAARTTSVYCVPEVDAAQVLGFNLPSAMNCGETYQASVTMKNTGTTTWTRSTHKLGANDGSDPFYNTSRVLLPHGVTVPPNGAHTFNFQLAAPIDMNPGTYLTDWRMVHEGVAWFGPTAEDEVALSCTANAAQILAADLPASLSCGESFQASVTVKNTGSVTWTRSTHKLGAKGGSDPFYHTSRVLLPNGVTVPPNASHTFQFTLTAEAAMDPGTYLSDWQMVHEGVAWFGPTAASNVGVQCTPDSAQLIGFDLPSQLNCGSAYQASVTMKNTGDLVWTRNTHKLGAKGGSDPFYDGSRVRLPEGVTVPPNGTHTFQFTLTAEANMTPGAYLSDWQMVHEGVAWFGPTAAGTVGVQCTADGAQLVAYDLPDSLNCGESYEASVTMRNLGTATWTRATHRLGAVDSSDPFFGSSRILLPNGVTVPPNGTHSFAFTLTAAATMNPGTYLSDWRMVHEGVAWFGPTAASNVSLQCTADGSQLVAVDLPTVLNCGETYAARVTVKNTGMATWTRATHRLGAVGGNDPFFEDSRIRLPDGVTVPPNGTHAFEFTLTADVDMIEGIYPTEWRMVHEGVGWFGPTASSNVTVSCSSDAAQIVATNLPSALACGESYAAWITAINTGTATWTRATHRLGAVDGSDPFSGVIRVRLPEGVTVPPGGSHSFSFSLDAAPGMNPGNYVSDWQMIHEGVGWFGPIASSDVAVNCGGAGPPEITALVPDLVPLGSNTTIVVHGSQFNGATVSIPGPEDPDIVPPQILNTAINSAGTRIEIHLDATDPRNEGLFLLSVETAGGRDAKDFRVAPNIPLVDLYTPSQVVAGASFSLLILGANLQGANLSATDPGVSFSDIDNGSGNGLTGIINLDETVNSDFDIVLHGNGGSVSLEVEVVTASAMTQSSLDLTRRADGDPPQGPFPIRPFYLQEFTPVGLLAGGGRQGLGDESGVTRAPGSCIFTLTIPLLAFDFIYALLVDGLGNPAPEILDNLPIGEVVNFGNVVITAFAYVQLQLTYDFCSGGGFNFCIDGTEGFEIPYVQSLVHQFTWCTSGGFSQFLQGEGILDIFEYSSPGECTTVTQLTEPQDGGFQYGTVRQDECCSEPIRATAAGVNFTGIPGFIRPWGPATATVGTATPDCNNGCIHQGRRNNGSLVNDKYLPHGPLAPGNIYPSQSHAYYYFRGGDKVNEDNFTCYNQSELVGVLADGWHAIHNNGDLGIGDISKKGGGYWSDHPGGTHQNGLDFDMRYPRTDGQPRPYDFSLNSLGLFDVAGMESWLDVLIIGNHVVQVIVSDKAPLQPRPGILVKDTGGDHDNHVHVEFVDPDGPHN